MNDALVHDILTSDACRTEASALVMVVTETIPENTKLYALLTSLASIFVGLCDDHDIDPEAALGQIADSLSRTNGELRGYDTLGVLADTGMGLN